MKLIDIVQFFFSFTLRHYVISLLVGPTSCRRREMLPFKTADVDQLMESEAGDGYTIMHLRNVDMPMLNCHIILKINRHLLFAMSRETASPQANSDPEMGAYAATMIGRTSVRSRLSLFLKLTTWLITAERATSVNRLLARIHYEHWAGYCVQCVRAVV